MARADGATLQCAFINGASPESVATNNTSVRRGLARMEQPFSALLLEKLPQNEYRRVASDCHVFARPTDSAGVLKGEVNTLTII